MIRYEVVLSPAAKLFVLALGSQIERTALADCLRQDLQLDGPNSQSAYHFPLWDGGRMYSAVPLHLGGIVAVYRPLTDGELDRLRHQLDRKVARSGCFVVSLLSPETGFHPH
ncbi:hypothetical protein E0H73_28750 [Kribbella pittospori]|uniref:Type II toxin-antitoxin system RelE/ParE family toxin n=1 Tax=Kribbella pittospori TaxID=722689 RepID=A0A4R0KGT7_9ACTN|nr:hypothetical protein [Kribbella pittospori]TCC58304.1 hypothetical protein E0H73_28750 [Kribbella pittospori]